MITDEKVERINALARKSRTEGLTEEEKAEQAELRQEYVRAVRESLQGQLDHTTVVEPDGTRHKLPRRD